MNFVSTKSLVQFQSNSFTDETRVDLDLKTAKSCQTICQGYADCQLFTYETEPFTPYDAFTSIYKGQDDMLDWLIVVGQDIQRSEVEIWQLAERCVQCEAGQAPTARGDRCIPCATG